MKDILSYSTMKASANFMRQEFGGNVSLASMSVSNDAFEQLRSDVLWSAQERVSVQRTMSCLRDGYAAAMGYTPFAVPAEYQAALIAEFVKPCNVRAACSWLADSANSPAEDLAMGAQIQGGSSEPVTAQQLFALVIRFYDEASGQFCGDMLDSKMLKQAEKAAPQQNVTRKRK